MAKKPSRTKLRNKADKLWSEIIRGIGECESDREEHRGKLEAAHIISRRYSRTRHKIKNGLCLCTACHMYYHANPVEFARFVEQYIGKTTYEEMYQDAQQTKKIDYMKVIEELQNLRR